MNRKKLFLIDGNSYCYRAYYAIKDLSTSSGQPTNAVYGFVVMLNKLISTEHPDYMAIAFDLKGPTFRHKKFADYKIHRKPMPDGLIGQLPLIKEVISAYRIPIFELEGFEADDIIATMAKKAADAKLEVYIVTGDKDILQLVDQYIKVYSQHKDGLIYGVDMVKERYGVEPKRIVEIMALMGDPSDNIPGVPGIGEKTAIELIKKFGSLESLLANIDKTEGEKRREILQKFANQARMSRELAVCDCNVPIEVDLEKLKFNPPDNKKLFKLFKELEFRKLLKDITPQDKMITDYRLVSTQEEFDTFFKDLIQVKNFVFDFETTSPNPMLAELVGISFCWKEGEAYYIPVTSKNFPIDYILDKLKPIFEDKKVRKIGQNIKYEKVVLANYHIELNGISFDTMIASYLLNPSKPNHNLEDISLEYLEHKMISISELIGKGKEQIRMDQVDMDKLCKYSCEDSDVTFRLKSILENGLREKKLYNLFCEVEIPLIYVLADMEINGVAIDTDLLTRLSQTMGEVLEGLTNKIYELAGENFNINSPKQLSQILFEKLKLPTIKRTKTHISTDVEVLEKLASMHLLPAVLLEYRKMSKLKSTYVDTLPCLINPKTHRIHTSFNQTVTATGRLSSSQPNLQNIPIRGDFGRNIRRAFVPEKKEEFILSADYSQIELRILACLSMDENLISAFKRDLDVHSYTASLIFGVEEKDVTEQMRDTAKTVNFGIIYGMSSYGLSKDLGIEQKGAEKFITSYFERYPEIKEFIDKQIAKAEKDGFVTTLLGRRRYIPEINSQNQAKKQFAERTAINTPIQGTASDLIKMAMININKLLKEKRLSTKLILQVHDELVFELPEEEIEIVRELVREKMEGVMELKVPIKVSIKVGKNWLEME